ncbi:glycosyltransferase family 4 protein [Amycolatopsis japonica]|uniref:glycosyltransferase family 4 protein n=1 Tax=Amycolatopsis japonica TaxID=208439 RepID=UPI0037944AEA
MSESAFTVKGHGVHSAFVDSLAALRTVPSLSVTANSIARTDVSHIHTVGPVSLLALQRANASVVTAHITAESLVDSIVGGRLFAPLWRQYLRWVYNRADVVVSLSRSQEAGLRRDGVISEIVIIRHVLPSFTLPTRTQARAALGIREDEKIILSVGQVQPRKAVNSFHRAAEDLTDVRFFWIGGSPFGSLTARYWKMRRLIRSCPHNVTHLGQLRRDTVQLFYAAADVYFHPSHQEHAPVAVLEAAAAGLPLVLRDIDCYRDLYPGHYLAATDESFATQIRQLLINPSLYGEMTARSAEIKARYSSAEVAVDLANIYQRLVNRKH